MQMELIEINHMTKADSCQDSLMLISVSSKSAYPNNQLSRSVWLSCSREIC